MKKELLAKNSTLERQEDFYISSIGWLAERIELSINSWVRPTDSSAEIAPGFWPRHKLQFNWLQISNQTNNIATYKKKKKAIMSELPYHSTDASPLVLRQDGLLHPWGRMGHFKTPYSYRTERPNQYHLQDVIYKEWNLSNALVGIL